MKYTPEQEKFILDCAIATTATSDAGGICQWAPFDSISYGKKMLKAAQAEGLLQDK